MATKPLAIPTAEDYEAAGRAVGEALDRIERINVTLAQLIEPQEWGGDPEDPALTPTLEDIGRAYSFAAALKTDIAALTEYGLELGEALEELERHRLYMEMAAQARADA